MFYAAVRYRRRAPAAVLPLCCLLLFMAVGVDDVEASPWTLPESELALGLRYDYDWASREYLSDGTFQAFPLNGQFSTSALRLETRYGFTDRLEGAADVTFRQLNFRIDPIVLVVPEEPTDLASINDAILDFSTTKAGVGDFNFQLRYNLRRGLMMVTTETALPSTPGRSSGSTPSKFSSATPGWCGGATSPLCIRWASAYPSRFHRRRRSEVVYAV
jgi:hypothetical protein